VKFTPWQKDISLEYQESSYTVMIYMNGSDLESEDGLATADLKEMIDVTGQEGKITPNVNSNVLPLSVDQEEMYLNNILSQLLVSSKTLSIYDKNSLSSHMNFEGVDIENLKNGYVSHILKTSTARKSPYAENQKAQREKAKCNFRTVVFTGGTNRWQNDVIPNDECAIWEIKEGSIHKIADIGLVNMGDAGTLSSFIKFGMKCFPAEKYGLIMWDHGGGSIAGYGDDENFHNSNLTLLDMDYAFQKAGLISNKLEFLGFDSCLMSSVEMAVIASDYAKYMYASEDLTPGEGWDYGFLKVFNEIPHIDGSALGTVITDMFMNSYRHYFDMELNMSVTDLSKAGYVMNAMGELMSKYDSKFSQLLAFKRSRTKSFGNGSPRESDCDMVDLGDMAAKMSDLFPKEASQLESALKSAVIYNKNNSCTKLSGLSTYYVYAPGDNARNALKTYAELKMSPEYTEFLNSFHTDLVKHKIWKKPVPENSVIWIDGAYHLVSMYKISENGIRRTYAVPSKCNGKNCDLILQKTNTNDITVLGIRNSDSHTIQKGFDPVDKMYNIAVSND
jgi:hypothetical protein